MSVVTVQLRDLGVHSGRPEDLIAVSPAPGASTGTFSLRFGPHLEICLDRATTVHLYRELRARMDGRDR